MRRFTSDMRGRLDIVQGLLEKASRVIDLYPHGPLEMRETVVQDYAESLYDVLYQTKAACEVAMAQMPEIDSRGNPLVQPPSPALVQPVRSSLGESQSLLATFAQMMGEALLQNDYKGNREEWRRREPSLLFRRVVIELASVTQELDEHDKQVGGNGFGIALACANAANTLLILADAVGGVPTPTKPRSQ